MLRQNQLGPDPSISWCRLTNLAGVLCVQGMFVEAEPYVKRVVGLMENQTPVDPIKLADSLDTLAGVLFQQAKWAEAETFTGACFEIKAGDPRSRAS